MRPQQFNARARTELARFLNRICARSVVRISSRVIRSNCHILMMKTVISRDAPTPAIKVPTSPTQNWTSLYCASIGANSLNNSVFGSKSRPATRLNRSLVRIVLVITLTRTTWFPTWCSVEFRRQQTGLAGARGPGRGSELGQGLERAGVEAAALGPGRTVGRPR